MKAFHQKKKMALSLQIILVLTIIIMLVLFLFIKFNKKATPKLISLAEINMNKFVDYIASDYKQIMLSTTDLNILTIKENSKDEIISIDYDMQKIYQIAEDLTNYLEENLNSQEKINTYINDNVEGKEIDGIILWVPLGQLSNSLFLMNVGPKIPVVVRFVNSVFTNVKTKVTDYGINNALLNISLEVKLSYQIITPLEQESKNLEYELLLDTRVVQGVVPNIYGGVLESKSTFLEVPFKK